MLPSHDVRPDGREPRHRGKVSLDMTPGQTLAFDALAAGTYVD